MKTAKKIAGLLAAPLVAMLVIAGCDSGYDCSLNNTSYENITFYTIGDEKEQPYTMPNPLTVSVMINGQEEVMVNNITDAENVLLPMSYTQECDTVIFHYHDNSIDSLYVTHTAEPYYKSMECGVLMFHKIEDIKNTNVWIEDVKIVNKSVNFENNENIRIYFYQ